MLSRTRNTLVMNLRSTNILAKLATDWSNDAYANGFGGDRLFSVRCTFVEKHAVFGSESTSLAVSGDAKVSNNETALSI
ncbi:hypothetical protein OGAPHI_006612 [Ogataea philodendri]|uniref:Uncharacterized protein n=1 Tax=Ogataea philodendri TaxID=1378263 RepID=A0A9P8T0T7_9ASCO|nr:uncharacterized protein OGAPHI_006612 [Ogataea philodendri]KAH3661205.1 hypothetical protein OGAPHI_006612 [Ogataea philodendri]